MPGSEAAAGDLQLSGIVRLWLGEPEPLTPVVRGRRVDEAMTADLERVVEVKRRMAEVVPSATMLESARAEFELVMYLLKNGSYTEQVASRLHTVATEHARMAGQLSLDVGDVLTAHFYYGAALRASHTCGDRALGAHVLGFLSEVTAITDGPQAALNVLMAAESAAYDAMTAVERALLRVRIARAQARLGDQEAAQASVTEAFRLWAGRGSRPAYAGWFDEAELQAKAGHALMIAELPGPAYPLLRAAVAARRAADGRPRGLAFAAARLAVVELALGDVDKACATASEALGLAERMPSVRLVEAVCEVALKFAPYRGSRRVTALIERATELAHAQTARAALPPDDLPGPTRPYV